MNGHNYDSRAVVRAALSDLITHGLAALSDWLRVEIDPRTDYNDPRIIDRDNDPDYAESVAHVDAAALLGVRIDAAPAEVRTAFRAKVKERMAHGAFHDQRGDETDTGASVIASRMAARVARGASASIASVVRRRRARSTARSVSDHMTDKYR